MKLGRIEPQIKDVATSIVALKSKLRTSLFFPDLQRFDVTP